MSTQIPEQPDHQPKSSKQMKRWQDYSPKEKKIGIAVLVVVLLILFASCTGGNKKEDTTPTPQQTQTQEAVAPKVEPQKTEEPKAVTPKPKKTGQQVTDDQFVSFVKENKPELRSVSKESLVTFANSVCTAKSNGATNEDIIQKIIDQGLSTKMTEMFTWLSGAAVPMYCPEYL